MTKAVETISEVKCFGGWLRTYRHWSEECACDMRFSIYLPPQVEFEKKLGQKVPVLFWLSGLTCTNENFITKAGAFSYAAKYGVALVIPDTSPRGKNVQDVEAWDFGQGAGFYLNATQEPWSKHFRMYDYINEELPEVIKPLVILDWNRCGIFGHSMGGHGALILGIRNPEKFKSVSAFSPICAPMECPWGDKAFTGYLGEDRDKWFEYDATQLMLNINELRTPILIDQGGSDEFLDQQLKPEKFVEACKRGGVEINYRLQEGYDHSYYFISSFVGDHIKFHAKNLQRLS